VLVLALSAGLGACAPTRQETLANLGEVKPQSLGPLKALVVVEIYSENTKTIGRYASAGKAMTFGTANTTLIPGMHRLLEDTFKSVIKANKLEQAQASGADVIAVIDVFGVAKRYGFGIPDFRWEGKLLFLKPTGEEIAAVHGKSHKRSVAGGIIGLGGLLPTSMVTTAVTNHATEKEALDLLVADFEATGRAKLARFAQARSASGAPAVARRSFESDVDTPNYKLEADPRKFALVVGVEKYKALPEALYAERDAAAAYAHLLALGYPERNIKYLSGPDATNSGLQKNLETWLARVTKADSSVFFYFSGHGAPDPETGKAYLVPWDGDPQYLKETAYPVQKLYEVLGSLKAGSVVVALDSCFSGTGGRSVLPKGVRPLVSKIDVGTPLNHGQGAMVALTASAGNQISGTLDEQGHGLFTYYLLKGLNGAAPSRGGRVTAGSLYEYLKPAVEEEAARENRNQTPQLMRSAQDKLTDPALR